MLVHLGLRNKNKLLYFEHPAMIVRNTPFPDSIEGFFNTGATFHLSVSNSITKSLYRNSFIKEMVAAVPVPKASLKLLFLYSFISSSILIFLSSTCRPISLSTVIALSRVTPSRIVPSSREGVTALLPMIKKHS